MSFVFVVDSEQRPQAPVHPGTARWLLSHQKAAVWRRYPFTVMLKSGASATPPAPMSQGTAEAEATPLQLKLDPGSKTTGLAIVNDATGRVVFAAEFGHPQVQAQALAPLKDAAAVNATRWARHRRLAALGMPLETATGGRTKWNRTRRNLPKTHWLDAANVGQSTPQTLNITGVIPLEITAAGRHSRQTCRTNAYGFPDKAPKATSEVGGLRTGDMVRATVPSSSVKAGTYVGRLAVRATGFCDIKTRAGVVQGIHVHYCQPLHRADGYSYQKGGAALLPLRG